MADRWNQETEWTEGDGHAAACGTVGGPRSRRDQGLLRVEPAGDRCFVLVNGFDAWIDTPGGRFAITSQRYTPDVMHPDGAKRIDDFDAEPWPRWRFALEDGTRVEQEIIARRGASLVAVAWRVRGPRIGLTLTLRPFFSGRDEHALHLENSGFRFDPEISGGRLVWRPYSSVPGIVVAMNGEYSHHPLWYRNFLYYGRGGADCVEDLASPGVFRFDFSAGEAVWIVAAEGSEGEDLTGAASAESCLAAVRDAERARRK